MRNRTVLLAVPTAFLLGAIAARLPVERPIAEFPELATRYDYRMLQVTQPAAESLHVRILHRAHADLDEESSAARAREVAEIVHAGRPQHGASTIVVELAWTWHSDLLARHSAREFPFAADVLGSGAASRP